MKTYRYKLLYRPAGHFHIPRGYLFFSCPQDAGPRNWGIVQYATALPEKDIRQFELELSGEFEVDENDERLFMWRHGKT